MYTLTAGASSSSSMQQDDTVWSVYPAAKEQPLQPGDRVFAWYNQEKAFVKEVDCTGEFAGRVLIEYNVSHCCCS